MAWLLLLSHSVSLKNVHLVWMLGHIVLECELGKINCFAFQSHQHQPAGNSTLT